MPNCRARTSGPSETRQSGQSNVGVAAHICAAAAGGARFDPDLTPEQRASHENGIWLCQTHAKLVDDDAAHYPKELLFAWKIAAEERAREAQGRPTLKDAGGSRRLVAFQATVKGPREQLQQDVERFLINIGAPVAWGPHYDLVRMVVYEIALNALEHGASPLVELESKAGVVALRDAGKRFGLEDLRAGGSGGHQALTHPTPLAGGHFLLVFTVQPNKNDEFILKHNVYG